MRLKSVDLKSLTPEELRQVEKDLDDPDAERGLLTEYEVRAWIDTWLLRLITDWNLEDENGKKLPITVENLDNLEDEDGSFLLDHARKRIRRRRPSPPFDGRSQPSSTDGRSLTPERDEPSPDTHSVPVLEYGPHTE
jgi:hypothetical protein